MSTPRARECRLDVSELEAPEPLFIALDALDALQVGEYLHLIHRREPYPLYAHLLERQCAWRILRNGAGVYEALLWHLSDPLASAACAASPDNPLSGPC